MTRIRVRRGTSAQWTAADPVLGEGELGFETDTGKLKIGNGSTGWTTLAYTSLDWTTLANKPAVVAAGATQADARSAIEAEHIGDKGQANGYASLDAEGLVPLGQLPITTADWETLEGKPAVVAAGVDAAAARAAISAASLVDGLVPIEQLTVSVLDGGAPDGAPGDVIDGGSV